MPRSGSTLLEQMLDRHPSIEAVGELPYIRALIRSMLEIHTRQEAIKVPELIRRLTAEQKRALGADYMQRAGLHRRRDTPFFVDKMPMNWSDVLLIREILPQARFIEIRRNGMPGRAGLEVPGDVHERVRKALQQQRSRNAIDLLALHELDRQPVRVAAWHAVEQLDRLEEEILASLPVAQALEPRSTQDRLARPQSLADAFDGRPRTKRESAEVEVVELEMRD